MMKMVRPAHADPHHSVDIFDVHRTNERGGPWCVAPAILWEQVDREWSRYLREIDPR